MTLFDLAIILVIGLSTLFAYLRGLLREFITLIALGVGTLCTLYFGDTLARLFGEGTLALLLGYGLSGLIGFIAATIGLEIFIARLSGTTPHKWDQVGGAIFGILRGWVLMGLVYFSVINYIPEDNPPRWVANSALRGIAASAAGVLESLGLDAELTSPARTDGDTA